MGLPHTLQAENLLDAIVRAVCLDLFLHPLLRCRLLLADGHVTDISQIRVYYPGYKRVGQKASHASG